MIILACLTGLIVGGTLGALGMALLCAASRADDRQERKP